jgi:hypothetical protein
MTAVAAAGQSSIGATINAPATLTCDTPGAATLTLAGQDSVSAAVDIMLVLDESGSVSANEFQQQTNFLESFVASRPVGEQATKFGVVTIGAMSRLLHGLSGITPQILNVIDQAVQAGGQSCIACAVQAAHNELLVNGRPGVAKMVVMLTDGVNNVPLPNLTAAVQAARNDGVLFLTIGVGSVSQMGLTNIATPMTGIQTAFFSMTVATAINLSIQSILTAAAPPAATSVLVTLAINPAFVVDLPVTSDGTVALIDNVLQWSLPTLGSSPVTLVFNVRVMNPGPNNAPLFMSADFEDAQGDLVTIPNPTITSDACPEDPQLIIQQLTTDLNACTAARDGFESDTARLTEQLAECSAARMSLNDALTEANAANVTLRSQLDKALAANAALQTTVDNLRFQLLQQGSSLNTLTASVSRALEAIESLLRQVLRNPKFSIPGTTPQEKLDHVVNVIALLAGRR